VERLYVTNHVEKQNSYYEMPMDDYKEYTLHNCNVLLDFDDNDAIEYINEIHKNTDTMIFPIQLNCDDNGVNETNCSKCFIHTKQDVLQEEMPETLKYSMNY